MAWIARLNRLIQRSLREQFPQLNDHNSELTSPVDPSYNCISWSLGIDYLWTWPLKGAWPHDIPRDESRDAFRQLLEQHGYRASDDNPAEAAGFERGTEKIALFATPDGVPTHAARQLPNGRWTSKLGESVDITHELNALDGPLYGSIVQIFQRRN